MTECQRAFEDFLDLVLREFSRGVPEFPTHMGLFEVAGNRVPQDRFTDISDAAAQDRQDILRQLAGKLANFPRGDLLRSQQISAEVLDFFFDFAHERDWIGLKGHEFLRHECLIRPSTGLQSELPLFLSDLHPMRDEQDASDYLQRLSLIAPLLDEAGALLVDRQQDQLTLPRFLARDTIHEIDRFMATEPRDNILYQAFAQKSENLSGVPAGHKKRMLASIEQELAKHTYPAYARLATALSHQERNAHDEPGLWRLPNGDAYYEFLLQCATTTSMSAAEIHELGLTETRKVESQIMAICRDLGHDVRTIDDCHRLFEQDEKVVRSNNRMKRAEVVQMVESIVESVRSSLPGLFHELPASAIVVKAMPQFAESSRNQGYQPPSLDGSRPGLMELNVGQLLAGGNLELELPTLVYHEVFPGHHLQMTRALESDELPLVRRIITFDAYIEGWAKYAETIPWDHGINTNRRWHLARMRRELVSTANLAMDTGIHLKRWSVEKAMAFIRTHTGVDAAFARYLVHRSAAVPAQLCAYKIGMLKVMELKEKMSQAQGVNFDIRDFHDLILDNGAVPLAMLERIVDRGIETNPQ